MSRPPLQFLQGFVLAARMGNMSRAAFKRVDEVAGDDAIVCSYGGLMVGRTRPRARQVSVLNG